MQTKILALSKFYNPDYLTPSLLADYSPMKNLVDFFKETNSAIDIINFCNLHLKQGPLSNSINNISYLLSPFNINSQNDFLNNEITYQNYHNIIFTIFEAYEEIKVVMPQQLIQTLAEAYPYLKISSHPDSKLFYFLINNLSSLNQQNIINFLKPLLQNNDYFIKEQIETIVNNLYTTYKDTNIKINNQVKIILKKFVKLNLSLLIPAEHYFDHELTSMIKTELSKISTKYKDLESEHNRIIETADFHKITDRNYYNELLDYAKQYIKEHTHKLEIEEQPYLQLLEIINFLNLK